MVKKAKPIIDFSTRPPKINRDSPASRSRGDACRAIRTTIWIGTVCIIGPLLYAAPAAAASVQAATAAAGAEGGRTAAYSPLSLAPREIAPRRAPGSTRLVLTRRTSWSTVPARGLTSTRFSAVICSGDPGYGSDSDSEAGSSSRDQADTAQSSGQRSARDAAHESRKDGGTRSADSGASDTRSPDSRVANAPSPGPTASDSRSPDSGLLAGSNGAATPKSGRSETERMPREPTALAQLPSTIDKTTPPSPIGSSQRGPGAEDGSAAAADPTKSFSEFVENYWPWLLAALALALFGLSRFLTKGSTEA